MMTSDRMPAAAVMMVRPAYFASNAQTQSTNAFQRSGCATAADVLTKAQQEFDALRRRLMQHHIIVLAFQQPATCTSPDAVFPNNWISFHPERIVLYPLMAENRRSERRPGWAMMLADGRPVTDLSDFEQQGLYLEGTGSLVLDRRHRRAYAALSPRTSSRLVEHFCRLMRYEAIMFDTDLPNGQPAYHTNVVLSIGERIAVICADVIVPGQRQAVLAKLQQTHAVVTLSRQQLFSFCGNILLLRNRYGQNFWVMSQSAFKYFTPQQRELLLRDGGLLQQDIPVIEQVGGGSVRCMLAEVF